MNEDKFEVMLELTMTYLQFIGSIILTLGLGVWPLIRCLINRSDFVYVVCFAAICVTGYTLMYKSSLEELREAKAKYQEWKNTSKKSSSSTGCK